MRKYLLIALVLMGALSSLNCCFIPVCTDVQAEIPVPTSTLEPQE